MVAGQVMASGGKWRVGGGFCLGFRKGVRWYRERDNDDDDDDDDEEEEDD